MKLRVYKTFHKDRLFLSKETSANLLNCVVEELGVILARELLKNGTIEVREEEKEDFYVNSITLVAEVDVDEKCIDIRKSDFFRWCYDNSPETIMSYLFKRDKKE